MYLTDLPDILTWQEPSPLLERLRSQFDGLLAARLDALLDRFDLGRDVDLKPYFAGATHDLSARQLRALLSEPEASFRLLWPSHHTDAEALVFLAEVLASRGDAIRLDRIDLEGLPLDAASRLAKTVDVSGTLPRRSGEGPVYDAEALRRVLVKAKQADRMIREGVPHAWTVVRDFTKLLHYLPDHDAPEQFSSGSSGQFVGRTVIANAHLEKVSATEISEALVHEAIHSVLYMAEQQRPWVLNSDLYAGPARIASPWTGNPLPLRPYLQACFVWYGLICYWVELLRSRFLNDLCARQRLDIALSGFRRVELLAKIGPFLDELSDEVKSAIATMQGRIHACVGHEVHA